MSENDQFTATVPVQKWMVSLIVWLIGGLFSGLAMTVGALVWFVVGYGFNHEQRLTTLEIDSRNHMSAYGKIDIKLGLVGDELAEIKGDLKVLKSRGGP